MLSSVAGSLTLGGRMDVYQLNKLIGYAVIAIIAYHVLQLIEPYLFWAVAIMVVWRIYLERKKFK